MVNLTSYQLNVVTAPLDRALFVEGVAGTGKTTVGVERLLHLMAQGVPGESILLLVPQRTLATPYYEALSDPGLVAGGVVSVLTVGGLAQRMVDLFWPLAAEAAGFAYPDQPPTFLTLESAQYYMAATVRPLLEKGYFESAVINRNRLYSQILDNLNKAALVGFPHTEIGPRLKSAWEGQASQLRIYDDAQECANLFRAFCLANNLLDFSLQLEIFRQHLWTQPLCRDYLQRSYRHLIADNLEEDVPVTHDLLRDWLPDFDSAALIYDHEAGYRRFLGADPVSAYSLRPLCSEHFSFNETFVTNLELEALGTQIGLALKRPIPLAEEETPPPELQYAYLRFFPEMLDWVVEQIRQLVFEQGYLPGQIAVLAPFLPDALRFSLRERLERVEIPTRSHRPSRALQEELAVHCLLTLAKLAHPTWGLIPSKYDVAYALVQAIDELDLVRANLLTEIVYRLREGQPTLSAFEIINPEIQNRITYSLGQRYDELRAWLINYAEGQLEELDYFFSRLFGELLAQPGFGFYPGEIGQPDYTGGDTAANLIESTRKFRWAVESMSGAEYVQMVEEGVIAAQYIPSYQVQSEDAVLLAPAYTFLMRNQPVEVQFWLDVGSGGWSERLYQPLTQPYILSRAWETRSPRIWTHADETEANRETLYRLTRGLLRRCRERVYLAMCDLNEQGSEQKGLLLKAIQNILRSNLSSDPNLIEREE